MITIDELKKQKRWTLWRLEPGKEGKMTKPPCNAEGHRHDITNPDNLRTYAELEPLASKFSGLGFALGKFDGVSIWGTDIDNCCDALLGKFSPEIRKVIIELNTYAEYSPGGRGCHLWGIGDLPGKGIQKPYPGCKQIEVKSLGYYQTYTGRHLSKTPNTLGDRQAEITALYNRVAAMAKPSKGLIITAPQDEETKFRKLMSGDFSDYDGDKSRADLGLLNILARRLNRDIWKMTDAWLASPLYREKLERTDYRSMTILKAIRGEPIFDSEEPMDEDAPTEWVILPLPGREEGWFPLGEVSLVGGPSGAGKTHSVLRMAESARQGLDTFGHRTTVSDYCILLHDRSSASMRRTCKAARVAIDEVMARVIRLSPTQQKERPATVVDAAIQTRPGVKLWILEGLDFWTPDLHKMDAVGDILDELHRVAKANRVAVVGTLGSPKQKENDRYASGRDQFMGSVAFGRKSETCISIQRTADKAVRQMNVMTRNTGDEEFFFTWTEAGLVLTTEPIEDDKKGDENSAIRRMEANVFAATPWGQELKYSQSFGPPATFFRWRRIAQLEGKVTLSGKKWFRAHTGAELCDAGDDASANAI